MANSYSKSMRLHKEYFEAFLVLGVLGMFELITEPFIYDYQMAPFRNPNHPEMPLPPHQGIVTAAVSTILQLAHIRLDPDTITKMHAAISVCMLCLLPAYVFYKKYHELNDRPH